MIEVHDPHPERASYCCWTSTLGWPGPRSGAHCTGVKKALSFCPAALRRPPPCINTCNRLRVVHPQGGRGMARDPLLQPSRHRFRLSQAKKRSHGATIQSLIVPQHHNPPSHANSPSTLSTLRAHRASLCSCSLGCICSVGADVASTASVHFLLANVLLTAVDTLRLPLFSKRCRFILVMYIHNFLNSNCFFFLSCRCLCSANCQSFYSFPSTTVNGAGGRRGCARTAAQVATSCADEGDGEDGDGSKTQ